MDFLYHQISDQIEELIQSGVLRVGDKLPSVRQLSRDRKVSLSTAFQTYYYLESKGLIEARPKSGYYVRFNPGSGRPVPQTQNPAPRSLRLQSIQQLVTEVYKELGREDIVWLSLASPGLSLLPIAKLKKSLQAAVAHDGGAGYADVQGLYRLRAQVAQLAYNWGGVYRAEDVVITAGCMEALAMCLTAATKPGDAVAIQSPTYFGFSMTLESLGLKPVEVKTDPETCVDLEALEKTLDSHPEIAACLFVPNFNNPLGSEMPDERKKKLVEMLSRRNIALIEDDIYGDLYYGKNRPSACKSFDKTGNVMYCSSVSKSLAPGFRIGWAIPGRWKDRVVGQKILHTVATNTLAQEGMAHFLEKGRYELHLRRLRKALHVNYFNYLQAIQRYFPADTKISRPKGGFVLWLELDKGVDAYQLYRNAITEGISIAPGQLFSRQGDYRNFIRVSFGAPWSPRIEKGIQRVGELARKAGP